MPKHCDSEKTHLLEPELAGPSGVAVNQPSCFGEISSESEMGFIAN